MMVFRGQKNAIEKSPSAMIIATLARIQYRADRTRHPIRSDEAPPSHVMKPSFGNKSSLLMERAGQSLSNSRARTAPTPSHPKAEIRLNSVKVGQIFSLITRIVALPGKRDALAGIIVERLQECAWMPEVHN